MILLSFFSSPSEEVLRNHRAYCARVGAEHQFFDATQMPMDWQYQVLVKYHALHRLLCKCDEGAVIVCATEDVVFLNSMSATELMQDRDSLVVRYGEAVPPWAQCTVWRNTSQIRALMRQIFQRVKLKPAAEMIQHESDLFDQLESVIWNRPIANMYPLCPCKPNMDPVWARVPMWAMVIEAHVEDPTMKPLRSANIFPGFREAVSLHVNTQQENHVPYLAFDGPRPDEQSERQTYFPGGRIALTTLYTPNIAEYGLIAERRMRQYCERHGYTLYVHRQIPSEIGLKELTGNWVKPWLLRAYLEHHEWVFWLDADVWIKDLDKPLDSVIQGRARVLAHDVGNWAMNAGIMGFSRTPEHLKSLELLMHDFHCVEDKSSVYASSGDQHHLIERLTADGMLDPEETFNFLDINTPWWYECPDSFMVHFFNVWPSLRAMLMSMNLARTSSSVSKGESISF